MRERRKTAPLRSRLGNPFWKRRTLDGHRTRTDAMARELTEAATRAMLPQPCVLVIFGGAGDLSWRKLLPAVYNLNVDGVLPSQLRRRRLRPRPRATGRPRRVDPQPRPRRHQPLLAPAARRERTGPTSPAPCSSSPGSFNDAARLRRSSRPAWRRSISSSASPAAGSFTWPCRRSSSVLASSTSRAPAWSATPTSRGPSPASSSRSRSAATSKAPAR